MNTGYYKKDTGRGTHNKFMGKAIQSIVCIYFPPTDLCLTDLDRILAEEQDPGAHHYLVLGTVPIKE